MCWSTQAPGDLSRALAALSSIKLPPLLPLTAPVPLPLFIVSDDCATRARAVFKRCAFLLPSQINVFPTLILTQKHRPGITAVPSDTNTHILIYTGTQTHTNIHTPYHFLLILNPWINKRFNVKLSLTDVCRIFPSEGSVRFPKVVVKVHSRCSENVTIGLKTATRSAYCVMFTSRSQHAPAEQCLAPAP